MAATVIPGPWSGRSEPASEEPKVGPIEINRAWADFFDRVGRGEQTLKREEAWTMARYFRAQERDRLSLRGDA